MKYQIWGDNTREENGFQSYINGYIDNKGEAVKTFNRYKREYKSYHRLELHELSMENVVKVILKYQRRKQSKVK